MTQSSRWLAPDSRSPQAPAARGQPGSKPSDACASWYHGAVQSACRGTLGLGSIGSLLLFGVLAFLLSCSAAPAPPRLEATVAPKPRWEGFDRATAWPSVGGARSSRGHGVEEGIIDVRISPEARDSYRGLVAGTALPVGTTVVAFHRATNGAPGPVYAMVKLPDGQWDFVIAEPNGTLVARGAVSLCAACHDDAPADHLFGVPKEPEKAPRN